MHKIWPPKMKKKLLVLITIVLVLMQIYCYLGFFSATPKFCLNFSNSQPPGVYRVVNTDILQNGDLVMIQVPDHVKNLVRERDLMPEHYTLLKTIYALPGETYSITDQTIEVNGRYVGRILDKDSAGRPLPVLRGTFTVQPGHFLPLATRVPNSFDGRYFGEVSTDLIVAKVVPFILFPEGI